jgi:hypothetical protein
MVLGGVGDIESMVVKDLAIVAEAKEVCIGDINFDAAKKII